MLFILKCNLFKLKFYSSDWQSVFAGRYIMFGTACPAYPTLLNVFHLQDKILTG